MNYRNRKIEIEPTEEKVHKAMPKNSYSNRSKAEKIAAETAGEVIEVPNKRSTGVRYIVQPQKPQKPQTP